MFAVLGAVITFAIGFFLGSIPWGVVFSKLLYNDDVRNHGSGNIGTTNMIRTYGKVVGIGVFALDFLKGVLSGLVGLWLAPVFAGGEAYFVEVYIAVAFLACTWGHIFSPWLGFKGGKGIVVAVGCLFVTYGPILALLELGIFGVLVPTTKYVSVGSVAAALACPFFAAYVFWGNWPALICCTIAGLTVVWAHRENISRLMNGTERRIGEKKKEA